MLDPERLSGSFQAQLKTGMGAELNLTKIDFLKVFRLNQGGVLNQTWPVRLSENRDYMAENLMRFRFSRHTGCLTVTVETVRTSKDRGKVHYLDLMDSNISKIANLLIFPHPDITRALIWIFKGPAACKIFCTLLKGHDAGGIFVAFSGREVVQWFSSKSFFWDHLVPHVTPLPGALFINGFLTSNLVPTWMGCF